MSSEGAPQGKRIEGLCKIVWGECDYELDAETDDWEEYSCIVGKDLGSSFGRPLTMTGLCDSEDEAWTLGYTGPEQTADDEGSTPRYLRRPEKQELEGSGAVRERDVWEINQASGCHTT